jgi:tetratricopeptide (TPR) repeat protein
MTICKLMKKYVHLSVLLISILFSIQATAQSPRKILREANQFIEVELYDEAINALRPLVENDHPEATLLTGISLLNQEENMTRASETLQKAARLYPLQQKKIDDTTSDAHFYLGQSFRMNGRAEKACETFKNLKRFITNNDLIVQIDREIEYCLNMQLLKQNPVNIEIEHLGKVLNSPYEDHSPIVLYDESTMYFTSNRPSDTTNMTGPYFENIFESHWRNGKWTEPKVLDIPNTSEANKATVGLTPDGP